MFIDGSPGVDALWERASVSLSRCEFKIKISVIKPKVLEQMKQVSQAYLEGGS